MKRWLALVVALLIASQSVAAFVDIHQLDQLGDVHVEFEHEHSGMFLDVASNDKEVQQMELLNDCNHCCHCHGSGEIIPDFLDMKKYPVLDKNYSDGYAISFVIPDPESIYRPPLVN